MSEILVVNESTVKVGESDGSVREIPIASFHFSNPKVGDKVRIFKDNDNYIVKREEAATSGIVVDDGDRRRVNKVVYVLLTLFLGYLGVHRFLRGQIGLGILMILIGWATFGIWWFADIIISLVKLSDYPGDDFIFTPDGRFVK